MIIMMENVNGKGRLRLLMFYERETLDQNRYETADLNQFYNTFTPFLTWGTIWETINTQKIFFQGNLFIDLIWYTLKKDRNSI